MKTKEIYFALWAEDINRYLRPGYNIKRLSAVRDALLDYISVDQDNPENIESTNLATILRMTGLQLDYSYNPFDYVKKLTEEPSSDRQGKRVNKSFLS